MKRLFIISFLILVNNITICQSIPSYYNGVDLSLSGLELKNELSQKIINSHHTNISYTTVWDVLKISDISPSNNSRVNLIYGWDDTDSDITNDLTRDKNDNGGNVNDWNREHTFPKSLGVPNLGTAGPGADAHNLRPSDVSRNGSRGNKKFISGSGIASGTVSAQWYPGDNWKGDAARIIMYMYLRYNSQCKPSAVTVGNPVNIDLNMVQLLLEWNADDPVDIVEKNRNEIIQQYQGNRNPFIDNPYLATIIWGGIAAENLWNLNQVNHYQFDISIYPNPVNDGIVKIESFDKDISGINIYSLNGKKINQFQIINNNIISIDLKGYKSGIYLIEIHTLNGVLTRKLIVK